MQDLIIQIERLANGHPDLRSDWNFGPASEEDVKHIESELGVQLPKSFRAYLLRFAGGLILGYEIYGVPTAQSLIPTPPPDLGLDASSESCILDIIDINKRVRKYYPSTDVFICSDGGDFSFFLDTAKMSSQAECPVIMYGPGSDGVQVADTFLEFLDKLAHRVSFSAVARRF
jgi:hypothetical protein